MKRSAFMCVIVGFMCAALAVLVVMNSTALTQEQSSAHLFSMGYKNGNELAGFAGRPMLLLFGDSRSSAWSEYLRACEEEPLLHKLLSDTLQGVFVDAATDLEFYALYGNPPVGTMMIKNLHGPILGVLQSPYTLSDMRRVVGEVLPHFRIERSPAYIRLLHGTDLLDELLANNEKEEIARLVTLLRHFEPGSQALSNATARAVELDVPLSAE